MTIWECKECYHNCKYDDNCTGEKFYDPSHDCPINNTDVAVWKPTNLLACYWMGGSNE
jgi:hypothetical protein